MLTISLIVFTDNIVKHLITKQLLTIQILNMVFGLQIPTALKFAS